MRMPAEGIHSTVIMGGSFGRDVLWARGNEVSNARRIRSISAGRAPAALSVAGAEFIVLMPARRRVDVLKWPLSAFGTA